MKNSLTCTRFDPPLVSREVSDAEKKKKHKSSFVNQICSLYNGSSWNFAHLLIFCHDKLSGKSYFFGFNEKLGKV